MIERFTITEHNRQHLDTWPFWLRSRWVSSIDTKYTFQPRDFPDSDGTDPIELITPTDRIVIPFGAQIFFDTKTSEISVNGITNR